MYLSNNIKMSVMHQRQTEWNHRLHRNSHEYTELKNFKSKSLNSLAHDKSFHTPAFLAIISQIKVAKNVNNVHWITVIQFDRAYTKKNINWLK